MPRKILFLALFLFCQLIPLTKSYACDYAMKASPFKVYFDARTIFRGKALKKGIEVLGNASYEFTLFEVIEPIKGIERKTVRIYHKQGFDGYRVGSEGLVVSIEQKENLYLADYCTLPFYDLSGPAGQSLFAVHHTILSRLGVLLMVSFIFVGFTVYLYIKSHENGRVQASS